MCMRDFFSFSRMHIALFCPPFRNHLCSFLAVFAHNASPDPSNLDFRHTCRLFVVVLLGQGCQFGPQRLPQLGLKGFAIAPPFHTGAPRNHDFAQERPIRANSDLDRLKSQTVNSCLNLFRSDGVTKYFSSEITRPGGMRGAIQ